MMIIEVRRTRRSVTQGAAEVWINGEEILAFGDTIKLVSAGEKYYGEELGGYASITPDSAFISGLFYPLHDNLYRHNELAKKAILKSDNQDTQTDFNP